MDVRRLAWVLLLPAFLILPGSGARGEEADDWASKAAAELRATVKRSGQPDAPDLPSHLRELHRALLERRGGIQTDGPLDALVAALGEAARVDAPGAREQAWRAAAAACHPGGVEILTEALRSAGIAAAEAVTGISNAVAESRCGRVHAWMVEHAPALWARLQTIEEPARPPARAAYRAALDASLLDFGDVPLNDDPKRARKRVAAAARKTLDGASDGFQAEFAAALGRVPHDPSRPILKKWLKRNRKKISDATYLALFDALGETGDEESVPLLLAPLEACSPAVLEGALVNLFKLPPEVLKIRGKEVIGRTYKLLDKEYRVASALYAKNKRSKKQQAESDELLARSKAWHTNKILDRPPRPLPKGAQAWPGLTALWWRILDAGPPRMKAPGPPKGVVPAYLNYRPNMNWIAWRMWWQGNK